MVRSSLGILLPLLIGLPLALWLPTWVMRMAVGFLFGIVFMTGAVIVADAAQGEFGLAGLGLASTIWLAVAAFMLRRHRAVFASRPEWPVGWGWLTWALLALAALEVVTAAGYAFKTPISDYDVTKVWLPKAQLLASGGLRALSRSVYPDYPPLWPVQMALAESDTSWFKLLPSAYLVATVAIVFEHVRARVGVIWAAACAVALSGVPYLWQPYGVNDLMSEIPTMAFVVASALMLAEYVETPSRGFATSAAALAVGLVWVRPEGFVFASVIAVGILLAAWWRSQLRTGLICACTVAVAYIAWRVFIRFVLHASVGLQPNLSALDPSTVLDSLRDTSRYAAMNLGNPYLFGPAIIAVALVFLGMQHWRSFGVIATVLVLDFALSVAMYVVLPSTDVGEPLIWWLTTGFKRMALHEIPLLYAAAALAIGFWWRSRDVVKPLRMVKIAGIAVSLVVLCVAAYAEYRVGGPESFDLSEMYPSHVYGPSVDYSTAGVMAVPVDGNNDSVIVFFLINTGRRIPPLDNITGTFTSFVARIEVQGPSNVADEFSVMADGKTVARRIVNPDTGPASITARIPLGTRLLELSVNEHGDGPATASWIEPTVERGSAWWLVEVLLSVAAALAIVSVAALIGGMDHGVSFQLIGRRLLPIAVLASAAVQQVEATGALLVPSWSFALRLLSHL